MNMANLDACDPKSRSRCRGKEKKVVVVENRSAGHHLTYLARIIAAFEDEKAGVVIASCNPDIIDFARSSGFDFVTLDAPAQGGGIVSEARRRFFAWRESLRRIDAAVPEAILVFFCFLDDYLGLFSISSKLPFPAAGIVFRPKKYWISPKLPFVRRGLLDPLGGPIIRSLSSVCLLDEVVAPKVASEYHVQVVTFPDIVNVEKDAYSHDMEEQIRLLANGRPIISLLGTLSSRKGLTTVLSAIRSVDSVLFVIAGKIDGSGIAPEEHAALHLLREGGTRTNAWVWLDGLNDGPNFNSLVRLSDVIYVCSEGFPFSSNILAKAAAFGVPVVSEGRYLIGNRIRRYSLGWCVEPRDFDSWCRDLTKDSVGRIRESPEFIAGAACYANQNSDLALRKSISAVLCHASRMPND